MFDFETPSTGPEVASALEQLADETERFLEGLTTEEFVAAQGEGGEFWSPAEHVRHLATAIGAVAQGMALPKLVLALRFGVARGGSGSFEEVRERYRAALAAGGQASGRYDPASRPIDKEPDELRGFVMERWKRKAEELGSAISRWSERELDRYRARHPLLGMMTARELLFFTLYHNAHHARRVAERVGGAG